MNYFDSIMWSVQIIFCDLLLVRDSRKIHPLIAITRPHACVCVCVCAGTYAPNCLYALKLQTIDNQHHSVTSRPRSVSAFIHCFLQNNVIMVTITLKYIFLYISYSIYTSVFHPFSSKVSNIHINNRSDILDPQIS